MRILVISDTHGSLGKAFDVWEKLRNIDLVIHCGDHKEDAETLEKLWRVPVVAVKGNCDGFGPAEEAIASLYEDTGPEEMKKAKQSLRNLVHDLKETLGRLGQGEALIRRGGALAIRPELLDCDYYRLLKDDLPSAHRFRGEYMEQFSWAERTKAALTFGQQR